MGTGQDDELAARQAEYLRECADEEARSSSDGWRSNYKKADPVASSLGFWKVALAVFVGNILTAIVAGLVYGLVK